MLLAASVNDSETENQSNSSQRGNKSRPKSYKAKCTCRNALLLVVLIVVLLYGTHQCGLLDLQFVISSSATSGSDSGNFVIIKNYIIILNNNNNNSSSGNRDLFLSVIFKGRLGNTLFQIAALYGIATTNNMTAVLPDTPSTSLRKTFPNLNVSRSTTRKNLTRMALSPSMVYHNSVQNISQLCKDVVLDGYFQSWRFFEGVENQIRTLFKFRELSSAKIDVFLREEAVRHGLSTNGPVTYVGVHVRRADLLLQQLRENGYSASDVLYFHRALQHFADKFNNTLFIVCSDDRKWVVQNLNFTAVSMTYSIFKDAESDLCLLSRCNHTVISVGSFGWWGGWLAGGDVVYDKQFPRPGSKMWRGFNEDDYYPRGWIGL